MDCINLLVAVYSSVGLIEPVELDYYPIDWHMHRDEQRFLAGLVEYCDPLPEGEAPLPGDIAMFQYGRHAAHGAIVLDWPVVIHAWSDEGRVTTTEADRGPLGKRLRGIYRFKGIDA